MSKTATYALIASQTASGSQSSITFSSVPQTYTDLILVVNGGTNVGYAVRFNSDSGSNYSWTRMYGNGSTPSSDRANNTTDITSNWGGSTNNLLTVQIMDYANATTNKTALTRISDNNYVVAIVGMWRNTNAINTVSVNGSANYSSGTTFKLYGIQAGNA
jgi:hypothetical protein